MRIKVHGYDLGEVTCRTCSSTELTERKDFEGWDAQDFHAQSGYVHFRCPSGHLVIQWRANVVA